MTMIHPTIETLRRLRLFGMAKALEEQQNLPDCDRLTCDERLAMLVDREAVERDNAALAQRLRLARLRQNVRLEDIDYRTPRGLDRSLIHTLASGRWLHQHNNILILGPTGTGKSFIACALGNRGLVQILVFPDFQLLDAAGPITTFEEANREMPAAAYRLQIVSRIGGRSVVPPECESSRSHS